MKRQFLKLATNKIVARLRTSMKLESITAAVVVLANGHNPSLLHPEFLEGRKIVPPMWIRNDDIVCTHAVSVVKYNGEGFILIVDNAKLQVTDNEPGEHPGLSPVFDVASNYISELPNVNYTALGLNFVEFLAGPNPEHSILDRFLKSDTYWQKRFSPKALGIKLAFELDNGLLSLSIESGNVTKEIGGSRLGMLIQANCHYNLPGESRTDRLANARKILASHADIYRIAKEHIQAIMGIEA